MITLRAPKTKAAGPLANPAGLEGRTRRCRYVSGGVPARVRGRGGCVGSTGQGEREESARREAWNGGVVNGGVVNGGVVNDAVLKVTHEAATRAHTS
jgi:hypothetical protein